jgi:hypothetical protein
MDDYSKEFKYGTKEYIYKASLCKLEYDDEKMWEHGKQHKIIYTGSKKQ